MKSKTSAGNFTLSAIFTTAIALSFTFGVVNLVRYVSATSSVEAATRKAIRCLTPTHGECLAVEPGGERAEWLLNSPSPQIDTYAESYDYRGTVYQERWQASYQSYETPFAEPLVSTTYQTLNRYKAEPPPSQTFLRYRWDGYEYRLKPLDDSYPLFNESYERSRVNSSPSSWSPPGFDGEFHRGTLQTLRIQTGSLGSVSTNYITVPSLDPTLSCISPGACRRVQNEGSGEWKTHAQLSLKIFARVRSANGRSAEVAWNRLGAEPAVEVRIKTARGEQRRALGGRTPEAVGGNWRWYNLWLRGPDGSHGGETSEPHSGILVPRGSRFKITARLTARKQPVDAEIFIYYYFDQYERVRVPLSFPCAQEIPANAGANACPSQAQCSVPSTLIDAQCREASRTVKRACPDGSTTGGIVAIGTRYEYHPTNEPFNAPRPLGFCGWTKEEGTVTAKVKNNAPSSLSQKAFATQGEHRTFRCAEQPIPLNCDGSLPPPSSCPSVQLAIEHSRAAFQRSGLNPSYAPLDESDFQWSSPSPATHTVRSLKPLNRCSLEKIVSSHLTRLSRTTYSPPTVQDFGGDFSPPPSPAISIVPVGAPRPLPIETLSPFAGGAHLELPDSDENGSCTPPQPLNEKLRQHAAKLYPELRDPSVRFEAKAIPLGRVKLASTGGCTGETQVFTSPPRCTPTRTEQQSGSRCVTPLGIFSRKTFPEGPSECRTTPNGFCHSLPAQDAPTLIEAIPLNAEQAGFRELKRSFPNAVLGCGRAGCASISASLSPEGQATATVQYQMPVHFPLNALIGRDSLPVTQTLAAKSELAFLRTFADQSFRRAQ